MPKIRLVEKKVVTPLTEKERSEVVTGLTNNPGSADVILSGGADAAIRYYQNGPDGSLSLEEVGELLDEFFESIKDDYALEEIVTIGTPHWSESLEGDIFPVKLRNKPMMYWVMYIDGYGKNVSRSTYSHAAAASDESNAVALPRRTPGKGSPSESMHMTPKVKKWYDAVIRDFKDYPDKKETGYEIEEILGILSLDEEDVETAAFAGLIDALSDAGYEMM